ncbi:RNase H domain-containing protein [Trichonephila clavipes]|nr:RNase H domain-containing protein [Trichonephila clavipes]
MLNPNEWRRFHVFTPSDEYHLPTNERLKTHKSFLSTVHDLYGTSDIPKPNHQVFKQEFNPIMCQVTLESHLDLVWNVGKQFYIPSDLKSAALVTIHCRYPLGKLFHVYTDGSVEDVIKTAGAGVFSSAFSISYPVGKYCNNFDGYNENAQVNPRRMMLIELGKSRESIVLQWIPNRCKIFENKKAYGLAKAGSFMTQPDSPFPLRNIKRLILNMMMQLQRHLHRIGVKDSACCPLCHQGEMDGDHPDTALLL